jgi:hypothetical protein
MFFVDKLAATREMNVQLTNDMSQFKTTVSRRRHDHNILKVFRKIRADQPYFLFRIAGRYNLKIKPKPSYLKDKQGSICDMICIHMNELSLPRKLQKKCGCNTHSSEVWSNRAKWV